MKRIVIKYLERNFEVFYLPLTHEFVAAGDDGYNFIRAVWVLSFFVLAHVPLALLPKFVKI